MIIREMGGMHRNPIGLAARVNCRSQNSSLVVAERTVQSCDPVET